MNSGKEANGLKILRGEFLPVCDNKKGGATASPFSNTIPLMFGYPLF